MASGIQGLLVFRTRPTRLAPPYQTTPRLSVSLKSNKPSRPVKSRPIRPRPAPCPACEVRLSGPGNFCSHALPAFRSGYPPLCCHGSALLPGCLRRGRLRSRPHSVPLQPARERPGEWHGQPLKAAAQSVVGPGPLGGSVLSGPLRSGGGSQGLKIASARTSWKTGL